MNAIKLTITIIAPVLISYKYDKYIPIKNDIILIILELTTTLLNVLNILIDVNAGNIIILLISIVPIILIPTTMTIAVSIAIKFVYLFTFNPLDFANSSSNVIKNTFL